MGKMYRVIWAAICCTLVLTAPAAAQEYIYPAELPCGSYDNSRQFTDEYSETPLFVGFAEQSWYNPLTGTTGISPYVLEFNVNQLTGTWSIIQVYATGLSCLLATGTDFAPYTE